MDTSLVRRVIDQAPLGVIILAPDLSVRYMNRAACALHSLSPDEPFDDLTFDQIVADPDSVRSALDMVRDQNMQSLIIPYEVEAPPPRRIISASVALVDCGADGTWTVLIAEDVTARKQLESELVETEKMALIGQLVVTLQHEINNQLQVIIGQADVALDSGITDTAVRSNLSEIRRSAQRIAARVHHLTTLDRIETVQYLDHIRMVNLDTDE